MAPLAKVPKAKKKKRPAKRPAKRPEGPPAKSPPRKARKPRPQPQPEPEGRRAHPVKPRDFDPLAQKDYREYERDAIDPHQSGPGT